MIDSVLDRFKDGMLCPLCRNPMSECSDSALYSEIMCLKCGVEIRIRLDRKKKLERDRIELERLRKVAQSLIERLPE